MLTYKTRQDTRLIEKLKNSYKNITGIPYFSDDCSVRSCKRLPIVQYIDISHIWLVKLIHFLISKLNMYYPILFCNKNESFKVDN